MRVLRSLADWKRPFPAPVLTIGNFDGVHRGHHRILKKVLALARARGGTAVVMTFEPHPAQLLHPVRAPRLLTTLEQKLALLQQAGVEVALLLPFTRALSRISPPAFVEEIIHHRIGAQAVCVGDNFRFGHRHAGDVRLLGRLARKLGFSLHIVPPVKAGGRIVSSSLLRQLIADGDVSRAARLLGRPFALTGKIQRGAGRGRPIGFPTLNLVPEQSCLPARGVYATETVLDGQAFPSATNVGVRPTFNGRRLVVESHLLNFSRTVRTGRLEVRFLARLRDERKFPSPAELRAQIARDVERARRFFARRRQSAPRRVRAAS